MKKLIKNLMALTIIFSSVSMAEKEVSTILMTESNGSYQLDFLNVDKITAIQFDVVLNNISKANISTSTCTSQLAKSHTGACQITKDGNLRFLIYSNSNTILDSGSIGNFKITGIKPKDIKITKLLMGTPDSKEIKGNVLIDIGEIKPNKENDLKFR